MAAQGMHPGTPTMDTTTSMIPQLTTQMGQLQIGTGTSVRIHVIHKWQHFFISKIIHILWILSENWLANYVLGEKWNVTFYFLQEKVWRLLILFLGNLNL